MSLWSDITGGLDHAAGSIDESIGRQFDDTEGGGFGDQIQDFAWQTEHRENDDFIVTGAPKRWFDTIWDYDNIGYYEDSTDLPGPGTHEMTDPAEWIPDAGKDPLNTRKWLPIVVGVILLYGFGTAFASGVGEGLTS